MWGGQAREGVERGEGEEWGLCCADAGDRSIEDERGTKRTTTTTTREERGGGFSVDGDAQVAQRRRLERCEVEPSRAELGLGKLGHELGDQVGPGRELDGGEAGGERKRVGGGGG